MRPGENDVREKLKPLLPSSPIPSRERNAAGSSVAACKWRRENEKKGKRYGRRAEELNNDAAKTKIKVTAIITNRGP